MNAKSLRKYPVNFIEPLESRIAPATFTVTSLAADNAASPVPGTLRYEINLANMSTGHANTIVFGHGVQGDIELDSAALSITNNLTINGPGASKLTIDAGSHSQIFAISTPTVTLNGLTLTGGKVTNGGGAIITNGTLTVNNCHILDNETTSGNGGAIASDGSLTIENSLISGNEAANGRGGAIYDDTMGAFVMKNTIVSGNSAMGGFSGGGIFADAYHGISITGSTVADNTGTATGGGIYANAGNASKFSVVTISNTLIAGNSMTNSNYEGGGVFASGGAGVSISGCTVVGNTSAGDGGGILAHLFSTESGNIVISKTTFFGNSATGHGAGLDVSDFNIATGGQIVVSSSTFNGNQVPGNGGGIYLKNDSAKTATISGVTVTNNNATGSGGGLYDASLGPVLVKSSRFSGNTALVAGGAIASVTYHSLTVQSSTVSDNSSVTGGGIFIGQSNGSFSLLSSKVTENQATADAGGIMIRLQEGNHSASTITGSTISNNWAGLSGGGVYIYGTAQTSVQNSTISGNVAKGGSGGGLVVYFNTPDEPLHFTNDKVSGNAALGGTSSYGGGFYFKGASIFTLSGGSVTGNMATGSGGGVGVIGGVSGEVSGTHITGNESLGWGAGFASAGTGQITITKPSLITGNLSAQAPTSAKADIYGSYTL